MKRGVSFFHNEFDKKICTKINLYFTGFAAYADAFPVKTIAKLETIGKMVKAVGETIICAANSIIKVVITAVEAVVEPIVKLFTGAVNIVKNIFTGFMSLFR